MSAAGPDADERVWILRIQVEGSREAAELLVGKYYREMNRYLVRQLRDPEDAADLTQELFVTVLAAIGRYDASRASFRTWLYRAATNKVIDAMRSRRRRSDREVPLEFDPVGGGDLGVLVAGAELEARVHRHLSGLPVRAQQVLRMRLFGGETFAGCAAALGLPESSVKSVYYRALAGLREELRDAGLG